jgi:hypothetical protein
MRVAGLRPIIGLHLWQLPDSRDPTAWYDGGNHPPAAIPASATPLEDPCPHSPLNPRS